MFAGEEYVGEVGAPFGADAGGVAEGERERERASGSSSSSSDNE